MINTVIFDMDGVIVDTEPVHHYAYKEHFKQLNIDVSQEMYSSFTGSSTKNIYSRIKEYFNLEQEIEILVRGKRDFFNNAFDKKEDLFLLDGVEDLIKELHSNGMQLVLASSSANETIERIFNRFDLHQYFTFKVSGEDFPQSKPHPAIFLKAAELAQTSVENCIVIEDSTNGIKAANAATIFCVGYKSFHSKLQDYSSADLVIEHFSELSFDKIRTIKNRL
ncbi:HAD family hydrolase [Flavobacterium chungnamense]|uniref:HAD family hydrolase n=1 Tax=Flavobacterium chungnamense TaxID=706182 RepID=A0ABP7UZU3_9FLAO